MADVFERLIETRLRERNQTILELVEKGCLYDNVVTDLQGRRIQVRGRWLDDFASCNYLGFDLNQEIIESVEPALKKWGVHPSWCRLVASPNLYVEAEEKIADFLTSS